MVKCIRCNEPIVHFSPIPCVCDTCYAVDDLSRHAEAPRTKPSTKEDEWVDMMLEPRYYQ
jgi:hypothetical protein